MYLLATRLGDGWARRHLAARADRGKEDPTRIGERLGLTEQKRPEGPLLWVHAASVGESLSILDLISAIRKRWGAINVLLTTGTKTSATMMETRLPEGVIHQYAPIDTATAARAFLDHWEPDLAIWTESEFWPRLVMETAKRAPLILVNGRISEDSKKRWRWMPLAARQVMDRFSAFLVQSDSLADRLRDIGAAEGRIFVTGSLKSTAEPLPDDPVLRATSARDLQGRSLWLAASTHEGEEMIIAHAHLRAKETAEGLALILVPRHPERGDSVALDLRAAGLSVAQRSKDEEIGPQTDVYLADTMGELGAWYRLAPVAFIGGSLVPVGGHNPFEPALLDCAILHGAQTTNFAEIYTRLKRAEAAIEVSGETALADALLAALEPERQVALIEAARGVIEAEEPALDLVLEHLAPWLDQAALAK